MQKPATYSGIRAHALRAMQTYRDADTDIKAKTQDSIIARLYKVRNSAGLDDLDIASECADHLLAGIDTTSDTLMFLVWALSLPKNAHIQRKLIQECESIDADGIKDGVVDLVRMPGYEAAIMRFGAD